MYPNSDWQSKGTVIKGNYGEELVDKFLESKGFICYFPKTKGAHWFDRLAVKDKSRVIVAESKTKARLNYLDATGFNYRNYLEYKRVYENHKIHVFVFFVDEMLGKIYGNFLQKLDAPTTHQGKQYPKKIANGTIIVFPLCNMVEIADLNNNDITFLKANSQRNYRYEMV